MSDPKKIIEEIEVLERLLIESLQEVHTITPLDDEENLETVAFALDEALTALRAEKRAQERRDQWYAADFVNEPFVTR